LSKGLITKHIFKTGQASLASQLSDSKSMLEGHSSQGQASCL